MGTLTVKATLVIFIVASHLNCGHLIKERICHVCPLSQLEATLYGKNRFVPKGSFLEATLNGKNFLEATLNEKNLLLKEQILTLKDSFPFRITLLFRKENKRLQKMSSIFKTWSYIHLS